MNNLKIRQCRICTKPFQTFGSTICRTCSSELDRAYLKVREYLYSGYEKKDIASISEATEVEEKIILYLLREGRLTAGEVDGTALSCENCGKPIPNGKLCEQCTTTIKKAYPAAPVQQHAADQQAKTVSRGARMYTNRDK